MSSVHCVVQTNLQANLIYSGKSFTEMDNYNKIQSVVFAPLTKNKLQEMNKSMECFIFNAIIFQVLKINFQVFFIGFTF